MWQSQAALCTSDDRNIFGCSPLSVWGWETLFQENPVCYSSCLLFSSTTTYNGIIQADTKYMQWIALDEDVAVLIVLLIITPDSIKSPELFRQGDIRAPTFSADFEEEKQAGRNSCRGAQKQHLLLFCLVCPCSIIMSRLTVCFAKNAETLVLANVTFWQALEMCNCRYRLPPLPCEAFFKACLRKWK